VILSNKSGQCGGELRRENETSRIKTYGDRVSQALSGESNGRERKKGALAAWAARITAMLLGRKEGEKAADEMKPGKDRKN
jgi:hypothetical protein